MLQAARECIGIRLAHAHGKRGRHHNGRAAVHGLHAKQRFQLTLHIGIVGVRLVHHEYPIRQSEQSQRRKPGRQNAHERLVDGAHANLGQQCAAPVVGQPPSASGFGRGVVLRTDKRPKLHIQSRPPVQEADRWLAAEQARSRRCHAVEHRVGRGHGRQSEEQAARTPGCISAGVPKSAPTRFCPHPWRLQSVPRPVHPGGAPVRQPFAWDEDGQNPSA